MARKNLNLSSTAAIVTLCVGARDDVALLVASETVLRAGVGNGDRGHRVLLVALSLLNQPIISRCSSAGHMPDSDL